MEDPVKYEWGIEYRGITAYRSEAQARRQLDLAQMDVPAVLVRRQGSGPWELADGVFCRRDWGMHSCGLLEDHEGSHLCVCGEREEPGVSPKT